MHTFCCPFLRCHLAPTRINPQSQSDVVHFPNSLATLGTTVHRPRGTLFLRFASPCHRMRRRSSFLWSRQLKINFLHEAYFFSIWFFFLVHPSGVACASNRLISFRSLVCLERFRPSCCDSRTQTSNANLSVDLMLQFFEKKTQPRDPHHAAFFFPVYLLQLSSCVCAHCSTNKSAGRRAKFWPRMPYVRQWLVCVFSPSLAWCLALLASAFRLDAVPVLRSLYECDL